MKKVFCWLISPLIFAIVIGLSDQIAHARKINLPFNAANFSSPVFFAETASYRLRGKSQKMRHTTLVLNRC